MAREKQYNDMTRGPVWRCILLFALPIMLGQLLQQLYQTVDGIVVGNFISSGALAAVGSCGSVTFIFIAFSVGMANGSGIIISQYLGAGRKDEMRAAAANILLLLSGLAVVIMAYGILFGDFTAETVLGIREPEIRQAAATYLRIYSVGMLFTFLYNGMAAILRAVGDSKAVLYFLLVSTVLNTALDLLFVTRMGMGIAGAAWATVISQAACMAVSVWYMFRNYPDFRFSSLRELRFDREKMKLCLKMGIPSTLQNLIISCGHLVLQRLVNSFGEVTMAAVTVGGRFDHYTAIPSMGMMQGLSSFTGQNTGAGRLDRVKKGLGTTVALNVCMVAVVCVGLYVFAPQLSALFGVEGEAQRQSVEYLRFISLAYPIFAAFLPFNGMFQGVGDPMAAATVSFIALIVRLAGAYFMVKVLGMGYASCWQTYGVGWVCALIYAVLHYFFGNWQKKCLVSRRKPEEQV